MHYDAREAAESHKCMPDKCMPENITEQNHRRNDKKKKNFSYCELKVKNINISKHTPYLTCTQWHMYGRTESFFFFSGCLLVNNHVPISPVPTHALKI